MTVRRDVALALAFLPRYLAVIGWLTVSFAADRAVSTLREVRHHRAEWRAYRCGGGRGGGEYPGLDRPRTWGEKKSARRADREQG